MQRINKTGMVRRTRVDIQKMRDVSTGSPVCARYGEAVLVDTTPVQGLIPYGALILKFIWNLGNDMVTGFGGMRCHKVFGYPKLDLTGAQLPLVFANATTRKLSAPDGDETTRRLGGLYMSALALIEEAKFTEAVEDHDLANDTDFITPILMHRNFWAQVTFHQAPTSCDNEAVVYAQFVPVFQAWFDMDFYTIQKLPLHQVIRIYQRMMTEGPHIAFEPIRIKSRFRKKSQASSGAAVVDGGAGGSSSNTNAGANNKSYAGKKKTSDKGYAEIVTLELTLKRAISLFHAQREARSNGKSIHAEADDDDEDGGGDGELIEENEEGAPTAAELAANVDIRGFLGTKRAAPKGKAPPAKKVRRTAVSSIRSADGTVYLSTNSREVRLPKPDMDKVPADAWVRKQIETHVASRYTGHMDMCVDKDGIIEMVAEATSENFPVEFDTTDVWRLIKDMVCDGRLGLFEPEGSKYHFSASVRTRYGDDVYEMPDEVMVGLASALKHEHETYAWLRQYLERRYQDQDYMKRMAKTFSMIDSLFNPDGAIRKLTLSEGQWQAVALAVMTPLVSISGAGGTGKTTLIKIITRILRASGLRGGFLYTAFMNDTVDATKDHITALNRDELPPGHPPTHSSKSDIFLTCDYVAYRWGPLKNSAKREAADCEGGDGDDDDSVDGEGVANMLMSAFAKSAGKKEDDELRVEVVFVEEASMLSAAHVHHLLMALHTLTPKHIIFIGDKMQLAALRAGEPFSNLIDGLGALSVRLIRGFRTNCEVLQNNLEAIRNCDIDAMRFDEPDDPNATSVLHTARIDTMGQRGRSSRPLMRAFGDEVERVLRIVDPKKTKIREVVAISPYNDISRYVACRINRYYFDDATPDDTYLDYAYGEGKWKPSLPVESRVVIIKTDKDKGHSRGHVGFISAIFDHGYTDKPNPLAHPTTQCKSTGAPKRGNLSHRTVVVDKTVLVTDRAYSNFATVLEPGGCITAHRSQGAEFNYVICLVPPGVNLCSARVFYTMYSRTRIRCDIIGSSDQIEKMITTPARVPHTTFLHTIRTHLPVTIIDVFSIMASEAASLVKSTLRAAPSQAPQPLAADGAADAATVGDADDEYAVVVE